jgi:hypothetical protein
MAFSMIKILAVAVAIFILSSCATMPPNQSWDPDTLGTQGARAVDDSSATRIALTRVAAMATVEQQQRDAEATAVAQAILNATAQSQMATRTELDNQLASMEMQATGTAMANRLAVESTSTAIFLSDLERELNQQAQLEAEEIAALATARAAEAKRDELTNNAISAGTWVLGIVSLVSTIILSAWMFVILVGKWKEKTAPIIQIVHDDNSQMFRRIDGRVEPVGRSPQLSGATVNQMALPARIGEQPPAKWSSFMNWKDFSKLPLGAVINDTDDRRRPLLIDPRIDPFLMIVGRTRSGKSIGGLMPYILAMWAGGAHVVVINGYGADFQPLRGLPNVTFFPQFQNLSDYLEPLAAFLSYIREEGQRRNGVLAQYRVTDWRQLPVGVDGGPILIAIDELLGIILSAEDMKLQIKADIRLTANERKMAMAQFDRTIGLIWSGLNQIASMYGKHGIHIAATLTDPTAGLIGDVGMAFRRQCAAMAFKMQSAPSSREFLNVDSRDNFPRGSVGLPTGQFIASINGDVVKCAAFYPSPQDVGQFSSMKRPFIIPSPLPPLLGEGLQCPELLTIGDDDVISGVFEENTAPTNNQVNGRLIRNVMILSDNINRFNSPTGAAKVLFVARGELDQATNPAGWMIEEARETLHHMAVNSGDRHAAQVIGLA